MSLINVALDAVRRGSAFLPSGTLAGVSAFLCTGASANHRGLKHQGIEYRFRYLPN